MWLRKLKILKPKEILNVAPHNYFVGFSNLSLCVVLFSFLEFYAIVCGFSISHYKKKLMCVGKNMQYKPHAATSRDL